MPTESANKICAKPTEELDISKESQWRCFSKPEIKDLAWLFFSPNLIEKSAKHSAIELYSSENAVQTWLSELDEAPTNKIPLRKSFNRLGLYFEALLEFIFVESPALPFIPFLLVQQHLQVINDGRTLGEIDYILTSKNAIKIHMEATVKFYLQTMPNTSNKCSQQYWVGPNANDRLDIKFDKTFTRQLTLSSSPDFLRQYPNHKDIQKTHHIFSGMLFHHWQKKAETPEALKKDCLRGHWIKQSEFKTLADFQNYQFRYLPKLDWLGGNNLQNNIKRDKEPVLSRACCFERYDKTGNFLGRLMVVPDYWPSTKAPSRNI